MTGPSANAVSSVDPHVGAAKKLTKAQIPPYNNAHEPKRPAGLVGSYDRHRVIGGYAQVGSHIKRGTQADKDQVDHQHDQPQRQAASEN